MRIGRDPAGVHPRAANRLDAFLKPKSVAVVGASNDPTRVAGSPLHYLLTGGYAGAIYPVNPNRTEVQGLKAYPSVADIPQVPDLAVLALPAAQTLEAVRQCALKGVRAAVLLSAGYAEVGEAGARLQDEIAATARAAGMRLVGPNCLGLLNVELGVYATFSNVLGAGFPPLGGVGIASQSGAYAGHLMYLCRSKGIGLRYWITTGNEVDVTVSDAIEWLALQPDVKVIAAYVEAIRDGTRFVQALRSAHAAGKSVVILKAGRTRAGARAAASHTAALAGADQVYDAVFRQFGVYRAQTTEELMDVVYAAEAGLYPQGRRIGFLTTSGGTGVQMCDAAEAHGLEVPPIEEPARSKLQQILPFATVENPVDVTGRILDDLSLVERAVPVLLDDCGCDAIVASLGTPAGSPRLAVPLREALVRGVGGRRNLLVMNIKAPPEVEKAYQQAGFLVYEDPYRAVRAVAALAWLHRQHRKPLSLPASCEAQQASLGNEPLNEHQAKQVLAGAGVAVLRESLVTSADAAVAAAQTIGYPVVLKIVSRDLQHKTEVGGVLLNLANADAVAAGYASIVEQVRTAAPHARIDGVLVAPMAPKGVETIIGVTRDPTFGPVVMFGLGGIFVEVFEEVAFRLAPFDVAEAHRMIAETRAHRLLKGVRGAAPSDVQGLAETLAAVSRFAAANPGVASLDINPYVVLPQGQGGIALDAVLIPEPQPITQGDTHEN